MSRRILPLLLPLLWAPAVLHAQSPSGAACYRGRPQPRCTSFWLTEAYGSAVLATSDPFGSRDLGAGVEVGWMHAIGARSAVGGGVAAGYDSGMYLSLRPRYRRWLTDAWALDLGPGVRWTPGRIETVEAGAAVMWRDLAGVWTLATVDVAGSGGVRWLGGVKTGGQAGLVSYILGAITGAIYIATFPRD